MWVYWNFGVAPVMRSAVRLGDLLESLDRGHGTGGAYSRHTTARTTTSEPRPRHGLQSVAHAVTLSLTVTLRGVMRGAVSDAASGHSSRVGRAGAKRDKYRAYTLHPSHLRHNPQLHTVWDHSRATAYPTTYNLYLPQLYRGVVVG